MIDMLELCELYDLFRCVLRLRRTNVKVAVRRLEQGMNNEAHCLQFDFTLYCWLMMIIDYKGNYSKLLRQRKLTMRSLRFVAANVVLLAARRALPSSAAGSRERGRGWKLERATFE